LEPEERRALLGHEVAHHATGSLWWLVGVPALAPGVAILIAPSVSVATLIALTVLLRMVFYCAVSRPIEYRCDALGARVESREVMARALSRVVAFNPLDHSSRASRILHSFWTHPATNRRMVRLSRPARSGQLLRDLVPAAVAVVVAVVAGRVFASYSVPVAVAAYLGIGLLIRLAMRPNPWKALQKAPAPRRGLFVSWVVASLGSLVVMILGAGLDRLVLFLVGLGVLLLSLLSLPVVAILRGRALQRRQAVMLQLAEAPGDLVEDRAVKAKTYLADPVLLHAAAMAKVRLGDRAGADEDYATLLRRWPRFLLPRATWAEEVYREEPERALELLREVPAENPSVARLKLESWLRLGEIDKAKESLLPALAKTPLDALVLAGRASIALAEGKVNDAHEILEEAARQGASGNPTLLILSSRVAMAMGELESAEMGLDKAEAILEGLPVDSSVLRPDLLAARAELESLAQL
ncbi:MAG: M48 family metalloprotease, partial [Thermoanaerobaculia bacterium]|nr:M48 family metalloprotease [Thermoanaerobaculia bacterium]